MTVRVHEEHAVMVGRRMPWGVFVALDDGTEVFVDAAKAGHLDRRSGDRCVVVILDDERTPARGSLLDVDREVARRHRTGEQPLR
ncbi:hypothetical protein [Cellulosimicrobium cellulans]|uniref:hypothetical protein n=1 Tax=Cellulosimicrobium cellulans TaxID=1710 RepID=UPI00240725A0|nr:hypothetical protein [Cellulosimicrobium cellulans]MDF9877352.1 hypothetical protein [Cellulosimicrobium cellulans]